MRIKGYIHRVGNYYAVEIPSLRIDTQGLNLQDAYFMAKDAIESLVFNSQFKVEIKPIDSSKFEVIPNDPSYLVSILGL